MIFFTEVLVKLQYYRMIDSIVMNTHEDIFNYNIVDNYVEHIYIQERHFQIFINLNKINLE